MIGLCTIMQRLIRSNDNNKTAKQYRAGSYNDRRRRTAYNDRKLAWDIAMAPAKAIIEPPIPDRADAAAWWKVRREVVKDCQLCHFDI